MKYYIFILTALLSWNISAQVDNGCDGTRYFDKVFDNISNETIKFGENVAPNGQNVELFMDIYYPTSDNLDIVRPLIVFAHSGAFISGERSEMEDLCNRMAERGYVSATIDYRLLDILNGIPDSLQSMDIAIKASHDMRAALRFFMHSAIEDGNPYNINTDNIFVGGYSAGAITALITGLVDEDDVIQDFVNDIIDNNGGLQGDTGNPEYLIYEPEVKGIINLSGAIYDTSWIDVSDPIIHSFHGNMDEIVAHDYGFATVFNVEIIPLYGSSNIYKRTQNLGTQGEFTLIQGGDHTNIYLDNNYENDRVSFQNKVDISFAEIICGISSNISEIPNNIISVYPNPATDYININIPNIREVVIYDVEGRSVRMDITDERIDISGLSNGLYTGYIEHDQTISSFRFVKL